MAEVAADGRLPKAVPTVSSRKGDSPIALRGFDEDRYRQFVFMLSRKEAALAFPRQEDGEHHIVRFL